MAAYSIIVRLSRRILRWVLKPRIVSRRCWSKPLMTLMTMISTATPRVTPSTEIKVMTETNVLLGRRYRKARSSSNGSRDMGPQAKGRTMDCQRRYLISEGGRRGQYCTFFGGVSGAKKVRTDPAPVLITNESPVL